MKGLTGLSLSVLLILFTGCEETFYSNPSNGGGDLAPQGGRGDEKRWVPFTANDNFTGTNLQKLDILMVVDNSGSMGDEIAAVKNQLGNFVARLQARQAVDYQIGVTSTNFILHATAGNAVSRLQASTQAASAGKKVVKSASDADPVQIGKDILTSLPMNDGYSGSEMGILAGMDAIQYSGSEFMRASTDLSIITISDEDDHSDPTCIDPESTQCKAYARQDKVCPMADGTCPYLAANAAKSYLQGLGRSVLYNALVGLPSPACSTVHTKGLRYIELSNLMGFTAGNICTTPAAGSTTSPLEQNLLAIADSISRRGVCFNLSNKATGQEIEVDVNGSPLTSGPNGYQFDAATNAICFSQNLVLNGASIEISYQSLRLE